jgi:hypothetical protein
MAPGHVPGFVEAFKIPKINQSLQADELGIKRWALTSRQWLRGLGVLMLHEAEPVPWIGHRILKSWLRRTLSKYRLVLFLELSIMRLYGGHVCPSDPSNIISSFALLRPCLPYNYGKLLVLCWLLHSSSYFRTWICRV